jgi:hypothetical protein
VSRNNRRIIYISVIIGINIWYTSFSILILWKRNKNAEVGKAYLASSPPPPLRASMIRL